MATAKNVFNQPHSIKTMLVYLTCCNCWGRARMDARKDRLHHVG